jgi:oligosaccharide reducing-end xylanase
MRAAPPESDLAAPRESARTSGGAPRASRFGGFSRWLCALFMAVSPCVAACGKTVDSLGYDRAAAGSPGLLPLTGPTSYPNPFHDLLGKSETEINSKLAAAFQRLFHGDPNSEAVFFPVGENQGYIRDIFHEDIRNEGLGWGMIICVELSKQDEFDRLWAYAKAELLYGEGPNAGYFRSRCDTNDGTTTSGGPSIECVDPFGHEQFVTALLFAHARWKSSPQHDYEDDALRLFDVMLNKEVSNGGVVDGVTNMFDAKTGLVFNVPESTAANVTRPAIEMPGYYELWFQATKNPFWLRAAAAARAYFQITANKRTGFLPLRSDFNGVPLVGWDVFAPEGYRAQINIALDSIWFKNDPWQIDNANSLLTFFYAQGLTKYSQSYALDGSMCITCMTEPALVAMNGVTATIATVSERTKFVQAVWEMSPPSGNIRYFPGMLHILSLLVLSGQYRVY